MTAASDHADRPRLQVHLLWTADLPAQINGPFYQRALFLAEHTELHVHTASSARICPQIEDAATVHRIPGGWLNQRTLIGYALWQSFACLWLVLKLRGRQPLNLYAFFRQGAAAAGLLKRLYPRRVRLALDLHHTPYYYPDLANEPTTPRPLAWAYRSFGRVEQILTPWLLKPADLIFVLGLDDDAPLARLLSEDFGFDTTRMCTIPTGVDATTIDAALALRDAGAASAPRMIFAGNIQPSRLTMLEDFTAAVRRQAPAAELLICGTGSRAVAARLRGPLTPGLRYLGQLGHGELMREYARANVALVMINTRRRDHQISLPGKLLEALAMGLVVVTTDFAASRQLIEHGKSGFITSEAQPQQVVPDLLELMADNERRQAMGHAARASVAALTWQATHARWWAMLEPLWSDPQRGEQNSPGARVSS